MGFFEQAGKQLQGAVEGLVHKNRRNALINRLRIVIKNERENTARAYVALGKYYFDHLRDTGNPETDALCASVADSQRRMQRAFDKMQELYDEAAPGNAGACPQGCQDDCASCGYAPASDGSEAAPYDRFDTTPASIAADPDNVETELPHGQPVGPESAPQPTPGQTPAAQQADAATPAPEAASPSAPVWDVDVK